MPTPPLPEHDLVQPMEEDDESLAANKSGEEGLLMRMDVPSLHAGAKRFVGMCKGVTEHVLDHCNAKYSAPEERETSAKYKQINVLPVLDGLDTFLDDGLDYDWAMAFLNTKHSVGTLLRADGTEVVLDDLDAIKELGVGPKST